MELPGKVPDTTAVSVPFEPDSSYFSSLVTDRYFSFASSILWRICSLPAWALVLVLHILYP
jgi:hypothetical protein